MNVQESYSFALERGTLPSPLHRCSHVPLGPGHSEERFHRDHRSLGGREAVLLGHGQHPEHDRDESVFREAEGKGQKKRFSRSIAPGRSLVFAALFFGSLADTGQAFSTLLIVPAPGILKLGPGPLASLAIHVICGYSDTFLTG